MVTQSYALFSTILCYVMQHMRIKSSEIRIDDKIAHKKDKIAHNLLKEVKVASIKADPWRIRVASTERIERGVTIPAPYGFEDHTAGRFLINLRDVTAHGDGRMEQEHLGRKDHTS